MGLSGIELQPRAQNFKSLENKKLWLPNKSAQHCYLKLNTPVHSFKMCNACCLLHLKPLGKPQRFLDLNQCFQYFLTSINLKFSNTVFRFLNFKGYSTLYCATRLFHGYPNPATFATSHELQYQPICCLVLVAHIGLLHPTLKKNQGCCGAAGACLYLHRPSFDRWDIPE